MSDEADRKRAIIVSADADPEAVRILGDAGYTVDIAITDRKKREVELRRLNRTLKAHNNSSRAMMRAEDESRYLDEVCRIVVEDCGHAMVWIGYAEDDKGKTVRPVAYSGFEEGYLETLKITWADTERGRGPTGTAIRTGKPSTCRNMLTDPEFEPWREQALKRGYASSIVLPLIANDRAFGAITIYSREPDPFTEDELKLLSALAADLAYGITAIRLREERARMEDAQLFLLQCATSASGEDFFRSLARYLAATLDMDFVCIDSLVDDCMSAQTVAVYFDGKFEDNVAYALKDTPCGDVVGQAICSFTSGVRHLFPRDEVLQEMKAEGYVGTTLWSSEGRPIGLIAMISRKPLTNLKVAESLLKLVAIRAAGELEREWAAGALKRKEADLRYAQGVAHVGSWYWDAETDVTVGTDELLRIFGLDPTGPMPAFTEQKGRLYTAENWERVNAAVQETMRTGIGYELDVEARRADGEAICITTRCEVVPDSDGRIVGLRGTVQDITQRKQTEKELAETRADAERRAAQLESFISSMVDGVLLFDSEPKALMVNDALKRLLGTPMGLPLETCMAAYELRALDGGAVALEDYPSRRALRGEETEAARFRMATPWRESVVSISGSPVRNEHGRVVGGTLSFHDITDLVELEEYKDELYRREHHIAEVLQQALIPPEVPTEIRGFRIGVKYQPALSEAEVGGDFYDVFDLGNGKIGVLIGDVAGKGLSAAIRVAAARYSVRSYAFIDPRPSHVMTLANEALCKDSSDESAILTVFFAVINTSTGRVTYASAGHEPPVVCRASGIIQELQLGGLPFGVKESSTYSEDVLDLAPGDTIVLVTDGITEARGGNRVLFEKKGMVQYLADNAEASPDETASGLLEAATAHAGGRLQDDAAIVVVMLESRQLVR